MSDIPPEELTRIIGNDTARTYLVFVESRIAASAFIAAIEWYWYPPGNPRNRFFDFYPVIWHDLLWGVAAFPTGRLEAVLRLAKQLGLCLANGAPIIFGDPDSIVIFQAAARPDSDAVTQAKSQGMLPDYFPGTFKANGEINRSIFTIESDANSPIYKNRVKDNQAMQQAGDEVNKILNRGTRLTPAQIADYIYGSGPFPLSSVD
jgi:hypothetical protein